MEIRRFLRATKRQLSGHFWPTDRGLHNPFYGFVKTYVVSLIWILLLAATSERVFSVAATIWVALSQLKRESNQLPLA